MNVKYINTNSLNELWAHFKDLYSSFQTFKRLENKNQMPIFM